MAFPSKYDGKCKDCGSVHKIGDQIEKNNNEHWCIRGKNCQGSMQMAQVSDQSLTQSNSTVTNPFKRHHVTDEEEILWNSILDKMMEYDILADDRIKANSNFDSSNPAHVGQIKNFAFAVQQEMKKSQREDKSS